MKTSEVISILMKSIDKEIEIVIDNRLRKFFLNPMCVDSMCTKLCGRQSLVKKIWNADMKKKMKKTSLRLVFIEMIFKKKL